MPKKTTRNRITQLDKPIGTPPHARKLGLLFEEDIDPESRGRSFRAFGRESSLLGVFFAILGEFTNTAPTGGGGQTPLHA